MAIEARELMSPGPSTTSVGLLRIAPTGTELSPRSLPVISEPRDVLVSRMVGEFFKLMQLCLKHQPEDEDPIAFIERGEKPRSTFLMLMGRMTWRGSSGRC